MNKNRQKFKTLRIKIFFPEVHGKKLPGKETDRSLLVKDLKSQKAVFKLKFMGIS